MAGAVLWLWLRAEQGGKCSPGVEHWAPMLDKGNIQNGVSKGIMMTKKK